MSISNTFLGFIQEADPELLYTYCPTLMNEIPQKTVDTLISLGRWFI